MKAKSRQKPTPQRPKRRWGRRLLNWLALLMLLAASLGVGVGLGAWFWISYDLPRIERLADYRPPLVTQVFCADGSLLAEFYHQRRYLVSTSDIPPHVIWAFVSAEDGEFFEHQGIDYVGVLRAAWANIKAGRAWQGASTITQQVAQMLLLTPERNWVIKIRKAILAWRIESYLSKQDILYLYLNHIYLGEGAYGVEAAARTYFGKNVKELDLAEAALLAGLVQAPSRYSPLRNPRRARTRQVYVIGRMLEDGHITQAQANRALTEQLEVQLHRPPKADAPYYREAVRQWLQERYGDTVLYEGGLTVQTACDPRLSRLAQEAVDFGLAKLTRRQGYRGPLAHLDEVQMAVMKSQPLTSGGVKAGQLSRAVVSKVDSARQVAWLSLGNQRGRLTLEDVKWAHRPQPDLDKWPVPVRDVAQVLHIGDVVLVKPLQFDQASQTWSLELVQQPVAQAALLTLETHSGRVKAMIGGRDFLQSQFNRALQANRQPGSSFKPFIYAAAFDKPQGGYTPVSVIVDAPVVYDDPSSPIRKWKPRNYENRFFGPTTLRQALEHSRNVVTVKLLSHLGIDYVVDYARRFGIQSPLQPNLSLALGTSGVSLMELTRAYSVFANGGLLVQPVMVERVTDRSGQVLYEAQPETQEAISPATAFVITHLLRGVMEEGTGRTLRLDRPAVGKTGTTNDLRDAWFVGYTPELVCGVWVGQDDNVPLGRRETGARAAGPIWHKFMQEATAQTKPTDFPVPEGVVFLRVDRQTGKTLPPGGSGGFFEAFLAGKEPQKGGSLGDQPAQTEDFLQAETFLGPKH